MSSYSKKIEENPKNSQKLSNFQNIWNIKAYFGKTFSFSVKYRCKSIYHQKGNFISLSLFHENILYTSEVIALIINYLWQHISFIDNFFGHFLPPLDQRFNFFCKNYSFLFQFFGKPMKQPIAAFG